MQNVIMLNIHPDELKTILKESFSEVISQLNNSANLPQNDEFIKINEAARLLGVSKVTIHTWKKKGILPFHKISNKIYFKKHEVLAALKPPAKLSLKTSKHRNSDLY